MVPNPSYFIDQVNKYLPDQCRIFNTGDDLDGTAVFSANTCLLEGPLVAVAQMGEPRVRNAKVGSSILLGYTNRNDKSKCLRCTGQLPTRRWIFERRASQISRRS